MTGDGVVKKTDSSDKVCDGTLQGRPRLASSVDFSRLICFLDRALRGSNELIRVSCLSHAGTTSMPSWRWPRTGSWMARTSRQLSLMPSSLLVHTHTCAREEAYERDP